MLITQAVSEKGRINLKVKSAKRFCANIVEEEAAVADVKKSGKDNVAFAIFGNQNDANQAIELLSEFIAYAKKNPDVLKETIFRRR